MKLRTPTAVKPQTEPTRESCIRKTFTVKFITPLYGGGAKAGQPDLDMPIRAAAIRGQLRFWWRILNPDKSFADEQAIWGGMGDKKAVASRVRLRIKNMPKGDKLTCKAWQNTHNNEWNSGAGYAMGIQNDLTAHSVFVPRDANMHKSLEFTLELEILSGIPAKKENETPPPSSETLWQTDIRDTLRWWASFGGLGARTRRGLGSLQLVASTSDENLSSVTKAEVAQVAQSGCQCQLVVLDQQGQTDSLKAWATAVGKLKDFRQGANIGRNPGNGRSRWPEADSLRAITRAGSSRHPVEHVAGPAFPRAVFGLPIITHFKDNEVPDTTLYPLVNNKKQDRMGSPLILKAMYDTQTQKYVPIALLLPHQHLDTMGLQLEGGGLRTPQRFDEPEDWYSSAAKTAMCTWENSPLKKYSSSGDVLQAFLTFFAK